jgi:hypothetical protein
VPPWGVFGEQETLAWGLTSSGDHPPPLGNGSTVTTAGVKDRRKEHRAPERRSSGEGGRLGELALQRDWGFGEGSTRAERQQARHQAEDDILVFEVKDRYRGCAPIPAIPLQRLTTLWPPGHLVRLE